MRLWALVGLFANLVALFLFLHFMIFEKDHVEEFSEALALFVTTIESINKIFIFYVWRNKFSDLIDAQANIVRSSSLSYLPIYNEYEKVEKLFLRFYIITVTFTFLSYLFGSLYRIIFLAEREFLFKIRLVVLRLVRKTTTEVIQFW